MAQNISENNPIPTKTLNSMFKAFAKFNAHPDFDGSTILLSQSDYWMAQAKLFENNFTLTDTGEAFFEFKYVQFKIKVHRCNF